MRVDYAKDLLTVWRDSAGEQSDIVLRKGDEITIDGAKGEIWIDSRSFRRSGEAAESCR